MKNKPIIIIATEPNSILLEIFFKALKIVKCKSPLVLICCKKILIKEMNKYKFKKKINILNLNKIKKYNLNNKYINLIDIECKKINNKYVTKFTNQYIEKSFDIALNLIKKNFSKKVINGPLNKKTFLNKKFLGITEYLSNKCKTKKTGMLIYNKNLSVCPVTTHLPIKLVAKKISKKLVKEKIHIVHNFYKKNLKIKPTIAVTGLNPHCESILKFNEDEKIIKPAIRDMQNKRINVKGPFSADTIFSNKNRKIYDVVIGMYHDQVLTPIKTLFEFDAINITMGLSFLRITPDHGPNSIMKDRNLSDPTSFIRALEFLDNR